MVAGDSQPKVVGGSGLTRSWWLNGCARACRTDQTRGGG